MLGCCQGKLGKVLRNRSNLTFWPKFSLPLMCQSRCYSTIILLTVEYLEKSMNERYQGIR